VRAREVLEQVACGAQAERVGCLSRLLGELDRALQPRGRGQRSKRRGERLRVQLVSGSEVGGYAVMIAAAQD
jgi:hypothetical protein